MLRVLLNTFTQVYINCLLIIYFALLKITYDLLVIISNSSNDSNENQITILLISLINRTFSGIERYIIRRTAERIAKSIALTMDVKVSETSCFSILFDELVFPTITEIKPNNTVNIIEKTVTITFATSVKNVKLNPQTIIVEITIGAIMNDTKSCIDALC